MEITIGRPFKLCKKLVVVDGLPGCGKTMLSAVVSSLKRVEILKYSYEIETLCLMNHFKKIDISTAKSMIQFQLDLILYNQTMGRELNFRFSDLSSVFKSVNKGSYFKRIFGPGDEQVPAMIQKNKPILHLVTHCLSSFSIPIIEILEGDMLFINFHRDPLYMIKQNLWNMGNLNNTNRDFNLHYKYNSKKIPYFYFGQEERMLKANPKEKAIFFLEWCRKNALKNTKLSSLKNVYELTFESFVEDPLKHILKIEKILNTKRTLKTRGVLKREKIPRKILSHGRDLSIYRRVNWEKSNSKNNIQERNELLKWTHLDISKEAKKSLEWLLEDYNMLVNKLS